MHLSKRGSFDSLTTMAVSLSRGLVALGGVGVLVASACTDGSPGAAPTRGDSATATSRQAMLAAPESVEGQDLGNKELILTFDDGPSQQDPTEGGWQTRRISTYLKNQGIRTTFFLIGGCATKMPAKLQAEEQSAQSGCDQPNDGALATIDAVLADGHLIGNHSTTHRSLTDPGSADWLSDVEATDTFLSTYVGAGKIPFDRLYFRAPQGNWSTSFSNSSAKSPGQPLYKYKGPIYWTFGGGPTTYGTNNTDLTRAADWECFEGQNGNGTQLSANQCAARYLNEIRSNDPDLNHRGIVLMHDAAYGNPEETNPDAVPGNSYLLLQIIMASLKAEGGWTFKSLWDDPALNAQHPYCDASCATCNGEGTTNCLTCASTRYLAGGSCKTCTAMCAAGTYQSASCSASADTSCSTCTTCAAGTYETAACGATTNTACRACTTCTVGTHPTTACSATADTACANDADGTPVDAGTTSATEDSGTPGTPGIPGTPGTSGAKGTGDGATGTADAGTNGDATGSSSGGGCATAPGASSAFSTLGLAGLALVLQRRRARERAGDLE